MAREAADRAANPGRAICDPLRDRFILFLPDTISTSNSPTTSIVRGFIIDMAVFARIHALFHAADRLTFAEQRVAFQLVGGITLRDAATSDGVTVETKRAQAKSAAAKLQCAGQTELVRLLMGQLTILLALSDDEARHATFAESYTRDHLDGAVQLTVERLPNGRVVRCLETGPAHGQPIVLLHGMMFGMLLSGAAKVLETKGLRLIMPVRRGYLDARPVLDISMTSRLIEESLRDLTGLLKHRGLAPAILMGHSLGAAIAISHAVRHPEQVKQLILLSSNIAGADRTRSSFTDRLYGAYKALGEGRSLSRAITLEFSRHYPDAEAAWSILERMFAASSADLAVMQGKAAALPVLDWFPELYRSSVSGIAEDYDFVMHGRWPVTRPAMPTFCIHGTEDPLTPVKRIESLVSRSPNIGLCLIEGAGHFACASHPEQVWDAITEFVAT